MNDIVKQGWSASEMHGALNDLINGKCLRVPAHPKDPDLVIQGTIDEVLALRAENAKLQEIARVARDVLVCDAGCAQCLGALRTALAALDGKEGESNGN